MIIQVASVQSNVVFNSPSSNFDSLAGHVQSLADDGIHLAVFPECCLTGYCVDTQEVAQQIALHCEAGSDFVVGEAHAVFGQIQDLAKTSGVHIIVGFAGKDTLGLYNGAILAEPNGRMRRYVKTHLPELGFDNFVRPGDALPVFETEIGRIGIIICYDIRPPEAARCLALDGADIIVLPTNWPSGTLLPSRLLAPARAAENKTFLVTCNRVGTENGWSFCGQSGIYGVSGEVLAILDVGEGICRAELDLSLARNKRNITGAYATELFETRQPSIYGAITNPRAHS